MKERKICELLFYKYINIIITLIFMNMQSKNEDVGILVKFSFYVIETIQAVRDMR